MSATFSSLEVKHGHCAHRLCHVAFVVIVIQRRIVHVENCPDCAGGARAGGVAVRRRETAHAMPSVTNGLPSLADNTERQPQLVNDQRRARVIDPDRAQDVRLTVLLLSGCGRQETSHNRTCRRTRFAPLPLPLQHPPFPGLIREEHFSPGTPKHVRTLDPTRAMPIPCARADTHAQE